MHTTKPTQPSSPLPLPQLVERLQKRFQTYRRSQPRGSRVPPELRNATVEAAALGASVTALRSACGVTRGQLARWRESMDDAGSTAKQPAGAPGQVPRVFSVVDSLPASRAATEEDVELTLQVGTWQLSLRLSPVPTREA